MQFISKLVWIFQALNTQSIWHFPDRCDSFLLHVSISLCCITRFHTYFKRTGEKDHMATDKVSSYAFNQKYVCASTHCSQKFNKQAFQTVFFSSFARNLCVLRNVLYLKFSAGFLFSFNFQISNSEALLLASPFPWCPFKLALLVCVFSFAAAVDREKKWERKIDLKRQHCNKYSSINWKQAH